MRDELILGLTGMGGYAGQMLNWLLGPGGEACGIRVGAVCDPQAERFGSTLATLSQHNIPVLSDYSDLLAQKIDAVYLPIPIHLHRQYTEAALVAGKPALCEKPAAGCVDDVDAMIAARDRASLPVAIGFQLTYLPSMRQIKHRLVAGEYGAVRRATVLACWPRNESYFQRCDWAGKISHHGQMVFDSPANNAMAHYIHLCLFLLGSAPDVSASPAKVESELYRANPIENYDTCSLRTKLDTGAQMLVGMTHACANHSDAEITVYTDKGEIRLFFGTQIEIQTHGQTEIVSLQTPAQSYMFRAFADHVKSPGSATISSLEMARSHSAIITAASKASSVLAVPPDALSRIVHPDGKAIRCINGMEDMLRKSVSAGQMLYESRLAFWARPGSSIDLETASK
ncbi:MAG TPA: Gfo/Idh/MocA family oxidoreductase [Tepidisphaeraceae bacterium]|nr:Gfo/Idh/MocA family oxidoreductase [Tepidisphaeraceae bacterium]